MTTISVPRLMLVTDRHRTLGRPLPPLVLAAARGGVEMVQVREKDLGDEELRALLEEIREGLAGVGRGRGGEPVRLVVNGRPDLARELGIGLHLPAHADPVPRDCSLPPRLCGRSVHDEAEARGAVAERPSYLLFGPVFATSSKPGHPGAGIEALRRVAALAAPVPVLAIGGVTAEEVGAVLAAGAHGVAVCGAVLAAPDAEEAASRLARALAGGDARSA